MKTITLETMATEKHSLENSITQLLNMRPRFMRPYILDLGKSHTESLMTEVGLVKKSIQYNIKQIDRFFRIKKVKTPITNWPGKSYFRRQPYGKVLIMSPWNYPFYWHLNP